jgi:uncharacterized protein DUF5916/cellulose/xylan binding protein with CBM9 domain
LLSLPFIAALTAGAIPGNGSPAVVVPRIEASARIDGTLDEPVWSQALLLGGFSQYQPVDSRPAEEETEVRVWYAPDAIYFGIVAHDSQPGTIRATQADRDNIDSDDHVIIYLDTFNDRRRAFFFGVNPLGVQMDGVRSEGASSAGNISGGTIDKNPDYYYESTGRTTPEGYVVEVRIPFKSLRYPGSGPQHWGLNFLRVVQRTGYQDTWTDVHRASASFLIQAGTLEGLHDLRRGIVFEAQPFVTGTANGTRDPASGHFERQDVDPDAGANVRLGLTSVSFDLTFNPDFSQVESDASQVTVNERFALFYPEKRPFFLEGIELFSTPNQLVYTRRIVDPLAGGKISGKIGPFGLAHLTAVDENVDGTDKEALFNVTRLRRDFGSNSVAGVTFTDRSVLDSGDYNRVGAADLRVVFSKLYYVEAQFGSSWTRAAGHYAESPLWKTEYDRTGRSWGFNYQFYGIGRDFDSQAGFVPRNDIVHLHAFNRGTWYGGRGALLESYSTFISATRIWRYGDFADPDGRPLEGEESEENVFHLRGGWEPRLHIARDFVHFEPETYAGYTVVAGADTLPFQPLDGVSGPVLTLEVSTPTYRTGAASVGYAVGRQAIFQEASAGAAHRVGAEVNLRAAHSIRIDATAAFLRLLRERDGSEFARTFIPRLKLEYQPTRALFFRLVGEVLSERQAALADPRTGEPLLVGGSAQPASESGGLRVDGLISYEPTPGTVAFFGYGSQHDTDEPSDLSTLRHESDGFFVKLAYQFRR